MWGKKFTARQATEDNMAHAHCMLDTQGYKHAHSGCVILIHVLKWLYESSSMLRYTYIACLAVFRKPWSFDSHCALAGSVSAGKAVKGTAGQYLVQYNTPIAWVLNSIFKGW